MLTARPKNGTMGVSPNSLPASKKDEYVRFNMGSSLNIIDEVVSELRNPLRRSQEQRFYPHAESRVEMGLPGGK